MKTETVQRRFGIEVDEDTRRPKLIRRQGGLGKALYKIVRIDSFPPTDDAEYYAAEDDAIAISQAVCAASSYDECLAELKRAIDVAADFGTLPGRANPDEAYRHAHACDEARQALSVITMALSLYEGVGDPHALVPRLVAKVLRPIAEAVDKHVTKRFGGGE